MRSLLYIKQKDILISGAGDKDLRLWNMSTYKCEKIIRGVDCSGSNSLYQIDENKIFVGGNQIISLVNISRCVIEKQFQFSNMGNVNCFTRLRDGEIICGCENKGIFYVFNVEEKSFKMIKDSNIDKINDIVSINDETVISCSEDGTIRVWMY